MNVKNKIELASLFSDTLSTLHKVSLHDIRCFLKFGDRGFNEANNYDVLLGGNSDLIILNACRIFKRLSANMDGVTCFISGVYSPPDWLETFCMRIELERTRTFYGYHSVVYDINVFNCDSPDIPYVAASHIENINATKESLVAKNPEEIPLIVLKYNSD
ncbi:MAG: hypothetical protein AB1454_01965 [Candidatus Auribacterota bacterium]